MTACVTYLKAILLAMRGRSVGTVMHRALTPLKWPCICVATVRLDHPLPRLVSVSVRLARGLADLARADAAHAVATVHFT